MKIPTATYRLQLNRSFKFTDANRIIPYLASLGISHCYASPILQARSGSTHGYDIVDHKRLNSEIGTMDEFDAMVSTLRHYNMNLIVDFVPNHMGIGKENGWWMDVLENGPASPYAPYFDIDWEPVRKELYGKVLLPILGNQYGESLRKGELNLSFEVEKGAFFLNYYEHAFPINPVSYPQIMEIGVAELREKLGDTNFDFMEYLSILSAFERLPDHLQPIGHFQRVREKKVQMKRLGLLCIRNTDIANHIRANLKLFKVENGDEFAMQRLHQLLEAQPYRLSFWRVASDEINYRRFFDVNDLAAIRTEDLRVFNDIHSLMLDLAEQGKLDGIRIDHPDGLFDPPVYFRRLQAACARRMKLPFEPEQKKTRIDGGVDLPMYVVAEKILAPFENTEDDWLVHGTTGYEFLDSLNNLIVAEENEEAFNEIYQKFTGVVAPYEAQKGQCKNLVLRSILASELNMLAQRLDRIAESNMFYRDYTLSSLRRAIRELVVYFPVYRTYANLNGVDKTALQYIDWAVSLAKLNSDVAPTVFDFIRDVLAMDLPPQPGDVTLDHEEPLWQSVATFAMKFQQFTGPVTAKSVEDTLFYRYTRLVCLNEVGSEPKRFGTSASAFHHQNNLRQQRTPYGMLATSTHDTKRSEDVRARLSVLSELPEDWRAALLRWSDSTEAFKLTINENKIPTNNEDYLLFQTIIGAMPEIIMAGTATPDELIAYRDRVSAYMIKAMREAKVHTSWIQQNCEYESAVTEYVHKLFSNEGQARFWPDIVQFSARLRDFGFINSLTQTLLKLTSPGVPDIYQGNEIWDFSLVDPDNRRPVDFDARRKLLDDVKPLLSQVDDGQLDAVELALQKELRNPATGVLKLFTTLVGLRARQSNPRLFDIGDYIPLSTSGIRSSHLIAFMRRYENRIAIILAPLKVASLALTVGSENSQLGDTDIKPFELISRSDIWADTAVKLPAEARPERIVNAFTGQALDFNDQSQIQVADLFRQFPFALLLA